MCAQIPFAMATKFFSMVLNRLTPNDPYMGRTAPLTSKRCILCIYSTNIGTEYFTHALYSPFFSSSKCSLFHNANLFGSCIIHISYTGCAKKNNSGAKRLITVNPQHINCIVTILSPRILSWLLDIGNIFTAVGCGTLQWWNEEGLNLIKYWKVITVFWSGTICPSGVPRGVLGCSNPPKIPKAPQNRAKLNPIVKTVKNCRI